METASGLRLYAVDTPRRMGRSGSLAFCDPCCTYRHPDPKMGMFAVELLFESNSTAKHYRLNNVHLHEAFADYKIVQGSIFLFEIETDDVDMSNAYIIKKNHEESELVLARPRLVI